MLGRVKAPIEAILKFSEVAGNMFLPKGMISSSERIFHIPENGVYPLEGRMRDSLFPATDDMRFVDASSVL